MPDWNDIRYFLSVAKTGSTLAAGRSAETVDAYDTAVAQFGDFLVERGMPTAVGAIHREHIRAFLVYIRGRPYNV